MSTTIDTPLADQPLASLLDAVAAERPAPGAGTCAALTCALAAGLAEMAASFTVGRERHAAVEPRMREIQAAAAAARERAAEIAQAELTSYEPVLAALRLPGGDPERERRLADALSQAAETPLECAALAAAVAALAADAARDGNRHLQGDALAGVTLAEASAAAAARLVEINLAGAPSDVRLARARAHAQAAARVRAEAELVVTR